MFDRNVAILWMADSDKCIPSEYFWKILRIVNTVFYNSISLAPPKTTENGLVITVMSLSGRNGFMSRYWFLLIS